MNQGCKMSRSACRLESNLQGETKSHEDQPHYEIWGYR